MRDPNVKPIGNPLVYANNAAESALLYCQSKNWDRNWSNGGCYLHLEVSEFIEALRGKGDAQAELGDVLFVLGSIAAQHGLDMNEALDWVDAHRALVKS